MKKTSKILLLILSVVVLSCVIGLITATVAFGETVIPIGSAEELKKIGTSGYPMDGSYKLTADIDLSGQAWTPILGNFTGVFDGDGHAITGMTSGTPTSPVSYASAGGWGMFINLYGTVKNLKLENLYFNAGVSGSNKPVGGICAYIYTNAVVENVYISGAVSDTTSYQSRVGSIAGNAKGPYTIRNCFVDVDITVGTSSSAGKAGGAGLVGSSQVTSTVSDCVFVGSVTLTSTGFAGNFLSNYQSGSSGDSALAQSSVTNCYSAATIDCSLGAMVVNDLGTKVSMDQLLDGSLKGRLSDAWTVEDNYLPYLKLFGGGSEKELENAIAFAEKALNSFTASNNVTDEDIVAHLQNTVPGGTRTFSVTDFALQQATVTQAGSLAVTLRVSVAETSETLTKTFIIDPIPTLSYEFTSSVAGRADGLISILLSEDYENQQYSLYWGTADGISAEYSSLTTMEDISVNGKLLTYVPESQTYIPKGITHLWLLLNDAEICSVEVPLAHRMGEGTLKYTFGVFSDVHFPSSGGTALLSFPAAMDLYEAAGASFVISCGDMSSNGKSTNYDQFLATYAAGGYTMPFWTALGNHDVLQWNLASGLTPAQALANLKAAVDTFANPNHSAGADYTVTVPSSGKNVGYDYTMAYGDDLFIFLGIGVASNSSTNASGELINVDQKLDDCQIDWLRDTLNKYYNIDRNDGQVYLIFHYYTLESGKTKGTASSTEWDAASSQKLDAVLREYPGVIHFNGHNHFYFDVDMNIYADDYISIHVPSLSAPKTSWDGKEGSGTAYESYIVSVYEEYILVNGVDAYTGTYVPHAMFMIVTDSTTNEPSEDSGSAAREIELRTTETHIQWHYVGDIEWKNLVALDALKGADGQDGQNGLPGANGREVEFTVSATHIQWRYVGDTEWKNLVALDALKGADGENGKDGLNGKDGQDGKDGKDGLNGKDGQDGKDGLNGKDGKDGREVEFRITETHIQWKYTDEPDTSWRNSVELASLQGASGADGKDGLGIKNVTVDENGNLILSLSDGSTLNAGAAVAPAESNADVTLWLSVAALSVAMLGVVLILLRKK